MPTSAAHERGGIQPAKPMSVAASSQQSASCLARLLN